MARTLWTVWRLSIRPRSKVCFLPPEGSLALAGHADLSGEIGSIDVDSTSQFVARTCYGMDEDGWNPVIDVFRLPFWDPQTKERFATLYSIR